MKPADIMRLKELLPTELGSEEIREQIARDILARSVFSARMESAHYLKRLREQKVYLGFPYDIIEKPEQTFWPAQ